MIYINFNYTNTLENIYNIASNSIFHIHGNLKNIDRGDILDWFITHFTTIEEAENAEQVRVDILNNDTIREKLQFGSVKNNVEEIKRELLKKCGQDEVNLKSIKAAIDHIIEFSNASAKDLKKNYSKLREFINNKNIDEVVVMGHSILGVDISYYEEIIVPKYKNCRWKFYCHSDNDKIAVEQFTKKFGIKDFALINW